jgi:hypothetical protein
VFKIDNQNIGQDVTEEQTVENLSASEQPAEQADGQLPDSAKEETREQFEKLKEHNKQLSEKLAALEAQQQPTFNSVLDELRPQQNFGNLSTAQVEDITKGLVDENGYVDQDLLQSTLKKANEKAQRAEDRAVLLEQRVERFEETELIRNVHSKHPSLDPYHTNYDPNFRKEVRDEILKQMKRGYQDYEAAADKVAAEWKAKSVTQSQTQKTKEEEQKKVISQREQASTPSARTGRQVDSGSYEDMDEGVRKGDTLSIGQKLQANGY